MINTSRFFRQSLMSYRALFGFLDPKIYFLVKVLNPVLQLIFFVLIAKYVNHSNDVTPWVLGNAFLLSMYNALFGVGAVIVSERSFGTLSLLVVSPTNNFFILLGRSFVHIFDAALTVGIGLMVGYLFFDVNFANANFPLLILCIIISMFSSMGIGLFIGSTGFINSDVNLVLNISVFALMIFSGALFPLEKLPSFLSVIPKFLPLSRGIEASKLIVSGNISSHITVLLFQEFLVGLVYMFLGYLSLKIFDIFSRKKGTLDIY